MEAAAYSISAVGCLTTAYCKSRTAQLFVDVFMFLFFYSSGPRC